jgi:hypothetical protein
LTEATGDKWPAAIERFLECALHRHREHRFASVGDALEAWRSLAPKGHALAAPQPIEESSFIAAPPDPPTVADEGVNQDEQPTWVGNTSAMIGFPGGPKNSDS